MPYGGNFHISKALNNVAVEYKNNAYISGAIPTVMVEKETDLYYTFNRDYRRVDARRADGAPATQIQWGVSTASYYVDRYGLSDIVTDRSRLNSDSINLDIQTTEFLTDHILKAREFQAYQTMFTTTVWGNNTTLVSGTTWRPAITTTSVPVQNVLSATTRIIMSAGVRPNAAMMSINVRDALRMNADLTNRIQYVGVAIATDDIIASMFDLPQGAIHVGSAILDIGQEGTGESLTGFWSDDFWIGYLAPSPGMKALSAAYNFQTKLDGSTYRVKKYRDEKREGDIIEVNSTGRVMPVATSAAFFYKSCLI